MINDTLSYIRIDQDLIHWANLAGLDRRTEVAMSEEDVGDGSTSMVISSADEGASLPSSAIVFPLVADLATSALPFVIIPSADRNIE